MFDTVEVRWNTGFFVSQFMWVFVNLYTSELALINFCTPKFWRFIDSLLEKLLVDVVIPCHVGRWNRDARSGKLVVTNQWQSCHRYEIRQWHLFIPFISMSVPSKSLIWWHDCMLIPIENLCPWRQCSR